MNQEMGLEVEEIEKVDRVCWCENCAPAPRETWTMKYRHECEVRYVVGLASNEARAAFLGKVRASRGDAAYQRLRVDAWELLK